MTLPTKRTLPDMDFCVSPMLAERLRRYGGFTYLASPITKYPAGQKAAAEHAGRYAVDLMRQQVAVFCPAMHGHMACDLGDLSKFTHDDWMRQCAPLVVSAAVLAVLMLPSWDESRGVRQEITWAKARDIPVVYLPTTEN